jgi:hypothetical protein
VEAMADKRGTNPRSLANLRPATTGSRAKVSPEFEELITANTVNALRAVLDVMENGKDAERLRAAAFILERALGKSVQPIDADVNANVKVEVLLPPGMDELAG